MEGLAGIFVFDNVYCVGSSGRSGGLCVYRKNFVQYLQLRNYSKYHIDMEVKQVGKDPWRLACLYGRG